MWLFKRTHQEHDYGIDGYIDIVTEDGHVTGQMFASQIKCGKSFFQEKTKDGYGQICRKVRLGGASFLRPAA